jgi:hypothetical protein
VSDPRDEEREQVAAELARIREQAHERALDEAQPTTLRAPQVRTPEPVPREAEPDPEADPTRPDNGPVNAAWKLPRTRVSRMLGPVLDAQEAFNSRQVQFDNELLAYLEARLAATHRHYDEVLGVHRRHMAEIDERHLIVQEELVNHVHDLVQRIDFVLAEAEKGRLGLEHALRDVRSRLSRLEESLRRT